MVFARAKQACHDEGEVGEVDSSTAADKALAQIEGAAGELDYLMNRDADADPENKVSHFKEKNREKEEKHG